MEGIAAAERKGGRGVRQDPDYNILSAKACGQIVRSETFRF